MGKPHFTPKAIQGASESSQAGYSWQSAQINDHQSLITPIQKSSSFNFEN